MGFSLALSGTGLSVFARGYFRLPVLGEQIIEGLCQKIVHGSVLLDAEYLDLVAKYGKASISVRLMPVRLIARRSALGQVETFPGGAIHVRSQGYTGRELDVAGTSVPSHNRKSDILVSALGQFP